MNFTLVDILKFIICAWWKNFLSVAYEPTQMFLAITTFSGESNLNAMCKMRCNHQNIIHIMQDEQNNTACSNKANSPQCRNKRSLFIAIL